MYHFHAMIHARPAKVAGGGPVSVAGLEVPTVMRPTADAGQSFDVSFEETGDTLNRLPRMFFEPDGSFVWVGEGPPAWQMDGLLYDRDGRLLYAEIKGCCPPAQFDQFLAALGWPGTPLLFQLAQAALFLEEAEFRLIAARQPSA
ncbi:MAG: hypothetical protein AB7O62_19755 [Pirellulales bacterium]